MRICLKYGVVWIWVVWILVGCESDEFAVADGGPTDGGIEPDESDLLFDPGRIIEIAIELDPLDWDEIRAQRRTILDIFGVGCLEEPFESPFTYVSGTVTVDGITVPNAGVRKKGFLGSLDEQKPSLKIKFDEYEPGISVHGLERLTLNNNRQDPSQIHQCLGYGVFAAAGVPAPRCNFAHVTVNGIDLGIYSHVESVKKRFLRRHFDNDEGQLYEGTLSDFRLDWTGTFEKKTNRHQPGGEGIAALTAALALSDSQFLGPVESIVNLDAFYTFWAVEVLLGHWDGYANNTNNFFIYHDPISDRILFIPWGIDAILTTNGGSAPLNSVFATGHLARRLYMHPESQAQYVSRLTQLLDTVWDEAALLKEVDRMVGLLEPFLTPENRLAVDEVRAFIKGQRQLLLAELQNGPPPWTEPPRDEICFEEIGAIEAEFSTEFGSLGEPNPFATGTGSISGSAHDLPIDPSMVGAMAGLDPESEHPDRPSVLIMGQLPDDEFVFVYAQVAPERFVSGENVEVDWVDAMVVVMRYDPVADESVLVGVLGGGEIRFEQADTGPDAPVRGHLSGPLVVFPF